MYPLDHSRIGAEQTEVPNTSVSDSLENTFASSSPEAEYERFWPMPESLRAYADLVAIGEERGFSQELLTQIESAKESSIESRFAKYEKEAQIAFELLNGRITDEAEQRRAVEILNECNFFDIIQMPENMLLNRRHTVLEFVAHIASDAKDMSLVDLGCGACNVSLSIAALLPQLTRVVALDSDEAAIQTAERNLSRFQQEIGGFENERFVLLQGDYGDRKVLKSALSLASQPGARPALLLSSSGYPMQELIKLGFIENFPSARVFIADFWNFWTRPNPDSPFADEIDRKNDEFVAHLEEFRLNWKLISTQTTAPNEVNFLGEVSIET